MAKRSSLRVQGEYSEIVRQMKAGVLAAMPWVGLFMKNPNEEAIRMIEEVAKDLPISKDLKSGHRAQLAKAADLLKGQ